MKYILTAITAIALLSCQKKVDVSAKSINGEVVESNNALYPFPCHATSFVTNYPITPGKTPPFRFTKTQYASGRIKTINMISRANPNHSAFKQQAWEVIGTFTYYSNKATLTGTKELWEYYKTSTGGAGKKSIIKKTINLTFTFWTEDDYAMPVGYVASVFNNTTRLTALQFNWNIGGGGYPFYINVQKGSDELPVSFQAINGEPSGVPDGGIITSMDNLPGSEGNALPSDYRARKRITFQLTNKMVNESYQPTQNWISLEYTICEAMGWVGYRTGERLSVKVEFYTTPTNKVTQSQVYKNYKYDTKGNMLSYTYGDNILQKSAWICK